MRSRTEAGAIDWYHFVPPSAGPCCAGPERLEPREDDHPFLTEKAAIYLRGGVLVGVDSCPIDGLSSGRHPVRSVLPDPEIAIVECLTGLSAPPRSGIRFSAVAPGPQAAGSVPVRAYARLSEE